MEKSWKEEERCRRREGSGLTCNIGILGAFGRCPAVMKGGGVDFSGTTRIGEGMGFKQMKMEMRGIK